MLQDAFDGVLEKVGEPSLKARGDGICENCNVRMPVVVDAVTRAIINITTRVVPRRSGQTGKHIFVTASH